VILQWWLLFVAEIGFAGCYDTDDILRNPAPIAVKYKAIYFVPALKVRDGGNRRPFLP
jgi:hypothetical protein